MGILDRLAQILRDNILVDVVIVRRDQHTPIEGKMSMSEHRRLSRDWIKGKKKGRYIIDGISSEITIDLDFIESIWAVPVGREEEKNE